MTIHEMPTIHSEFDSIRPELELEFEKIHEKLDAVIKGLIAVVVEVLTTRNDP